MNQVVGKKPDGTSILALALEPGNLFRLQQGEPITVRVQDMFPDGIPKKLELALFFSATPIADARRLSKMADVVFDERSAVEKRPHCAECKSTIEQIGILRNESPVALAYCPTCGCVFGVIQSAVVADLPGEPKAKGESDAR